MNTIQCPHCNKPVEISEALTHQMRETVRMEQAAEHKVELEKTKIEAEERALKKAKESLEFSLKDAKNEAQEAKEKNKELHEQLLEMNTFIRELKTKGEQQELEMQKKLHAETEKIQEETAKKEQEKTSLRVAEMQKKLEDTQKALEDAQRKAQQGSQQLQGEVLELDLETQLREQFVTDEILPVPKGIEGADVCQKVKNKFGQTAGMILWETKRTKAWSNGWAAKLREDKRRMNAGIAVLVSEVLPDGIETFGMYENIWVTSYKYAIPLVTVLRIGLFELAVAKSTTANKDEKLEALFSYLANDGFRNRFEAQVESIIMLRSDLEVEQRSTIRMWKKREMQIKRLMGSVATMYGELQGIMGEALPSLPSLDSGTLLADKSEQESLLE